MSSVNPQMLVLVIALLVGCSQEGTATAQAIDSGARHAGAESTSTTVAAPATTTTANPVDSVEPLPLSCPESGAADCAEPADLAHDASCLADDVAATTGDGTIEQPYVADGSVTLTASEEYTGEVWHYAITNIDVLDSIDDPLVGTISVAPDPIHDDHTLVAVAIHTEHEAGPANMTYPPFSLFVVDADRRSYEQQYNLVTHWSDGLRVLPPTVPVGTNGQWRALYQVASDAIDGLVVGIARYGQEPSYFAPC